MATNRKPQVGDLAWHKDGYDPRIVTRVTQRSIYIRIGSQVDIGPCPRSNYHFTTPACVVSDVTPPSERVS